MKRNPPLFPCPFPPHRSLRSPALLGMIAPCSGRRDRAICMALYWSSGSAARISLVKIGVSTNCMTKYTPLADSRQVAGSIPGMSNIELSRPADLREAAPVRRNPGCPSTRSLRGRLQRLVGQSIYPLIPGPSSGMWTWSIRADDYDFYCPMNRSTDTSNTLDSRSATLLLIGLNPFSMFEICWRSTPPSIFPSSVWVMFLFSRNVFI
jgi:hypothetical protein